MIHKFSLKNFYSFKDENEVSFVVDKNAPKTDSYAKSAFNVRVNKTAAVLGANASGKTNLLKALTFLGWFIENSFSLKPNEEISAEPFFFGKSIKKPLSFLIQFEIEKIMYEYNLELAENKVIFEELNIREKGRGQFSKLFKREWKKKDKKYIFEIKNYKLPKDFGKIIIERNNASIISIASQFNHQLSMEIVKYWNNSMSNVTNIGRADGQFDDAAKFFYGNSKSKKRSDELLSQFDLGLAGTKIEKLETKGKTGKKKIIYLPFGLHKIEGNKKRFPLPFFYESRGTQNLFLLLEPILKVLDSGGMLVLDEFDADLHPQMIPELVNLFSSKIYNPKNAQLFFSTHSPQILNDLDKYQIFFTEKGEDGASEVWRLDDIKGVRSDDNYYAKYISGAYGGVPNI